MYEKPLNGSPVEEMLEVWDWEGGFPTGSSVSRSRSHREGIPHEAVHLWIVRRSAGGDYILFQMRAPHKENHPGCLDITVGGHVPFGLKDNKAAKEASEEIGIDVDESGLHDLGWFRYEERSDRLFHREFQRVYVLEDGRPLDEYRFHDKEVTGIYGVRIDDFEELMKHDAAFRIKGFDGEHERVLTVSRKDFHPQLFDASMNIYMVVLLKAFRELIELGTITTRLAPDISQL